MNEVAAEVVAVHDEHLPAVREQAAAPTLFGTDNPIEVINRAKEIAGPLADLVRVRELSVNIQGREHVRVEGWTLLGSMLGVFPVCVWTKNLSNPDGWEARVEARTRSGDVVGAAEAQCTRDENQWSYTPKGRNGQPLTPRDDYALRSMAQTRATSKALRQPLGFVMHLAGFDATPAEEMPQQTTDVRNSDPHGFSEARADAQVAADVAAAPNAADVTVHFGKNAGTRLGDLSKKQLEWYAHTWEPNPQFANDQDQWLKAAAQVLVDGVPAATSDVLDEIPF